MWRMLSLLILSLALLAPPAYAQRGPELVLLGRQKAQFLGDHDAITIDQTEDWYKSRQFRALHFKVERNDVELNRIRIVYINGYSEEIGVNRLIRRGEDLIVQLPGERSYLRRIEMRYASRLSLRGEAVIEVYGEIARRGGPPPVATEPKGRPGFVQLDLADVPRRDGVTAFRFDRSDGRYGQIRLRAVGGRIGIEDIRVRFGNGETQIIRANADLDDGELSQPFDLEGAQRFIRSIEVETRTRGPRPRQLALLAASIDGDRPGRPPLRDNWTLLGEREVGFGVDRDVILIGQDENWYRNRWFRSLHFTAERNDVYLVSIGLVYINGYREEARVDRVIASGGELAVALPGERSYLRRIEMVYRARPGFGGRAVVRVFGEQVRR